MKHLGLFILILILSCTDGKNSGEVTVIPRPNQMEIKTGVLKLTNNITFYTQDERLDQLVLNLSKGTDLLFASVKEKESADIQLILNEGSENDETYTLQTTKKGIHIQAFSTKGIFYGLQTLKQMIIFAPFENGIYHLPVVEIEDHPRFKWRGLMLDESRHFFGVEKVKQLLDLMSLHKLNIFHWHLTDAPGWRIEIKKYPKLTTVGGIGNDMDPNAPARYYTQEEIKEIVEYASQKHIEIIPEIDMPGHAAAANRAYPEFSGGGSESHPDFTFNPGYEGTYTYLTDILKEITELFPSPYIHVGGDEVHFGNQNWNYDKYVQKMMKRENLNDLKAVESYFIHRMADTIKALDKTLIGWDEIVDHKLPNDNALVMWWRHDKLNKLEAALEGNYNVILCPRIPLYFDFVQNDIHEWGRKWRGAFSTLELTYEFPPDTLPGLVKNVDYVKGIQANIWTERIQNNKRLDFMTHPRLSAMAEAAWTDKNNKNLDDFNKRLKSMLKYFEKENIYFYNPFNPELSPEPEGVDKRKQKR